MSVALALPLAPLWRQIATVTLAGTFCATQLACGGEIGKAVQAGDLARVKAILRDDPGAIGERDQYIHATPLYWAGRDKAMAELLLQRGADPNAQDTSGNAPLMVVASADVAELLINAGAYVNATNSEGDTPLHTASRADLYDVAELLLKRGATIEARDKEGRTPLTLAATFGSHRVLVLLLDNHSKIETRDNAGRTPLFHAVGRAWPKNYDETVKLLLNRGADINAVDKEGWTPIYMACVGVNVDAVRSLLDHGAIPNLKDKLGWTPLYYVEVSRSTTHVPEGDALMRDVMTKHVNRLDEIIALLKSHGARK